MVFHGSVANKIVTKVSKIDGVWFGDGRVNQTMMMPTEEESQIEDATAGILSNLEGMAVSNDKLTISSKDNKGEIVLGRDLEAEKAKSCTTGIFA